MRISTVRALEVIDSRGLPTIAAEVKFEDGVSGSAMVPSGASVGKLEALELRDQDPKRWFGKGVLNAVRNVNETISHALAGEVSDVRSVDRIMIDSDGTENKSKLGANAILAVSLANARALAAEQRKPLYALIAELCGINQPTLPTPMVNILSGGLHARWSLDMQDFLVVPLGAASLRQALDYVGLIYHSTMRLLNERGLSTLLADEGGFGPRVENHETMLKILLQAIERSGLKAGVDKDVAIAIDVAASHFWKNGEYELASENQRLSGEDLVSLLEDWSSRYPIVSIEDGSAEEDWNSWKILTERLGKKTQLVGDDVFVTNTALIKKGVESKVGNSVLIKLNQIGSLSETIDAIMLCKKSGYAPVISARSGDTEDHFISDLAVGSAAGQIKVGSIARSERTAKYNRLLEIEGWSGQTLPFTGSGCFPFLS